MKDLSKTFPIAGIGASAGGLEAIQKLVANIPIDSGMAFVIIQHLERTHESHLAEILSRCTKLPVSEITDGMFVSPNHIYTIPPNFLVAISNGILKLSRWSHTPGQSMAVDYFFSSLSESQKSSAIGVVLSGTASDGTNGLKAIKIAGGTTFAQDPQTAKFDGMPRSAIATGVVDLILAPEEIASELVRLAKHSYINEPTAELLEVSDAESKDNESGGPDEGLKRIFFFLRAHTQIDLSNYKLTTVKRRIQRQMMLHNLESIEKYVTYLKSSAEAVKALYEDIFIHVTEFFRDPDSFIALKSHIFPLLVKDAQREGPIRIWVPGCSTGEEAYSLAIALFEFLDEKKLNTQIQFFATDISERAIHAARKGTYTVYQVRGISEERLNRFFDKGNEGYKIKKFVRDSCIFSQHDLISHPPFAKLNLISCRNVLIYFAPETQRRIIPIFHYALYSEGYLWLGKAETPGGFSKLFSIIDRTNKIYTKLATTPPHRIQFPTWPPIRDKSENLKPVKQSPALMDYQKRADQVVLFKYSPSAVIINGDMEILQFRGRTSPYLEPSSGLPNHSLLKMAHPDLASQLRILVQAAKRQNAPARKDALKLKYEGKTKTINIEVAPLNRGAALKDRQFIVLFEDTSQGARSKDKEKPKKRQTSRNTLAKDNYIFQLQQELDATKEDHQSLVEEYESTQEELTSSNEELQSTNEELQSTNEELGTAKEELQATNEELSSLNDELQKRNTDLNALNEDLEKSERTFRLMVENIHGYAFVMLDREGHIASWNEGARKLMGYEGEEITGRHFSKFYPLEEIKNRKPENELATATSRGRYEDEGWRIRKDGSKFWAGVIVTTMYDTKENISGFAKIIRDLTEHRVAEEKIKTLNEGLEIRVKEKTRQLEEALRSRDEFLSIASHELKTPLTSLALQIQMTSESLNPKENKIPPVEKLVRVFEISGKQIKRLTNLVETLLDTSRIQTGKLAFNFEKINLTEIVRDMVDRFSEQLEKANCRLEIDIQNDVYLVADHSRLEQIVDNLLSNIIKYAPESSAKISLAVEEKKARLVVEDKGPGIPKERHSKIFERYERATAPRKISGLGLGLFIVKEVVKGHNGSIELVSDVGKGSKFIIDLPIEPVEKKDGENE